MKQQSSDGRYFPWVKVTCSCTGCDGRAVERIGTAKSHPAGVFLCGDHVRAFAAAYPSGRSPGYRPNMPWGAFWTLEIESHLPRFVRRFGLVDRLLTMRLHARARRIARRTRSLAQ